MSRAMSNQRRPVPPRRVARQIGPTLFTAQTFRRMSFVGGGRHLGAQVTIANRDFGVRVEVGQQLGAVPALDPPCPTRSGFALTPWRRVSGRGIKAEWRGAHHFSLEIFAEDEAALTDD